MLRGNKLLVACNKLLVARNMLPTSNMLLIVARAQQATNHVARNMLPRNMLLWCKRG